MRSGLTRAEKGEQVRRALLDAAREVFVRDGFHGASLDAVAEAAGLTKGAVYSRFDSKADLFLALLEERITERIAQVESVLGSGSIERDVAAVTRQYLDVVRGQMAWTLLVLEFRVHAARDPELNRRYAELHDRFRAALVAVSARSFDQPPDEVLGYVNTVLALGAGIALEHAAHGEVFTSDQIERWTMTLVDGHRSPGEEET
jgi:AcrR family transcriptional regulator